MAATRETECPCRFCDERVALPNCHANCSAYTEWRKYVIQCNKKLQQIKQTDSYLIDRALDGKDLRIKKRKRRNKNSG